MLSKSCIYGIQAAIFVASQGAKDYVPINRIASELNISFHFLTKVLQQLTLSGIMISYRGPKGGIALARPAPQVTLYDLIAASDGTEIFTECMLGLPGCGTAAPCPAHEHWVVVRQQFVTIAQSVTLASLGERASELNIRLAQEFSYNKTELKS